MESHGISEVAKMTEIIKVYIHNVFTLIDFIIRKQKSIQTLLIITKITK